MSDRILSCPRCHGTMKRGFVLDHSHGALFVAHWAPGDPEKSFWQNTKKPEDALPIGTFRCEGCGYLESYAGEQFAAK